MPTDPPGPSSADFTLPLDASTDEIEASTIGGFERRYEDRGELGSGGLGEVRRVYDRDLDRVVAMKVLREDLGETLSALARFVEEARMSARLQHPGIVPIHDVGRRTDGRPYFTMQVVEGRTFRDLILAWHAAVKAGAEPRWRPLVDVFARACEAVAYAHRQGVVHRDLKPTNIMVADFGSVHVVDWGLAILRGSPSESRKIAGTPQYMAPEQATGELQRAGPWSDVWALGVTLFELFVGRGVWGSLPRGEIVKALVNGEAPLLRRPRLAVPDPLWALVERCVRMDPSARPADAGEVAEVVREWLDGVAQRAKGRELVAAAMVDLERLASLSGRASALRTEAERRRAATPERAPLDEKRPIWALEDEAAELQRDVRLGEARHLQRLRAALSVAPDLPEAHRALADWYRERHAEAEAQGDLDAAAELEVFLRDHDREGRHAAWLEGGGSLRLAGEGEAVLHRYGLVDRRLVPAPVATLRLPIERPLAMGSWLLVVSAPGRATARYPVWIDRGRAWDGVVALPVGVEEDVCVVPAGPFLAGGDPDVPCLPRRRLWVDGFAIDRFPVTNAQFQAFLDDLVATGREEEALRHAPRERAGTAGDDGPLIYGREGGRFVLRPDADGDVWLPDAPVLMVDWFGAMAFAAWRAERTGLPWRLPTELEWEKAARGVDGRRYPWGDQADATWMCIRTSHAERAAPPVVSAYPLDESPYGVRGTAGGVRDWCLDRGSELGPPLDGDRALVVVDPDPEAPRVYRGGDWYGLAVHARSAYRAWNKPRTRNYSLGFRCARSL